MISGPIMSRLCHRFGGRFRETPGQRQIELSKASIGGVY